MRTRNGAFDRYPSSPRSCREPALTTVDQHQRRRGESSTRLTQLKTKSLHGRNNAILAKQDCAAEQGAVSLLFGGNENARCRLDVALVGGDEAYDWALLGNSNFLFAAFISHAHRLPINGMHLLSHRGVSHHAGRAEVPGIMALGEAAQTIRKDHDFERAQ